MNKTKESIEIVKKIIKKHGYEFVPNSPSVEALQHILQLVEGQDKELEELRDENERLRAEKEHFVDNERVELQTRYDEIIKNMEGLEDICILHSNHPYDLAQAVRQAILKREEE